MLQKTRGIVLRFTRYGETSIIVNIFTEVFGIQSYIVNSARSAGRSEMAFFQPLTLLDMVVYHKDAGQVMRIKEKRCFYAYRTLYNDIRKGTIVMFLNEILLKTLKEETHPESLFAFISEAMIRLDDATGDYENFHLIFLIRFARHLGFGIDNVAQFADAHALDQAGSFALTALLNADLGDKIGVSSEQRRVLLNVIIGFYNEHIHHLGEVKSLQILREALS